MLFKLDLSEKSYTQCKDLSQFDDRTITIQLYENGQPYLVDTKTIKLEAKNSNNNAVIQTAGITKKGNVITVELMKDITRVSGKVEMKIVLTENSKNISTFKFMLNVDSSVTESANILPSITVDVIELLQDKINQAILVKQETEHLIVTGGAASKGDVIKLTEQLDNNIQSNTLNSLLLTRSNNDFKKGQRVLTNGYYTINDGGKAEYQVTDNNDLVVDNMFVYLLPNGFKLALIHNSEIDARVLGFKKSNGFNAIYDNTPKIIKFMEYQQRVGCQNVTLKFPHGWFGFSSNAWIYAKEKQGFNIVGASKFGELFRGNDNTVNDTSTTGTVFFAISPNQEYILKIGNKNATEKRATNELINVSNITFWGGTCSVNDGQFVVDRFGNGCKTMLDLSYVVFSKFTDLTFTGGSALEYCVKWLGYEFFADMWMFRDVGRLGTFKSAIKTFSDQSVGTVNYAIPSGSIFNRLSFENVAGTWIDLGASVDVQFTNLSGEQTKFNADSETSDTLQQLTNHIDIPIFTVNDIYGGIIFNNISIQGLASKVYSISNNNYTFRTLFKNVNQYGYGTGLMVSNVNLQGSKNNVLGLSYNVDSIDQVERVTYANPEISFKNYQNVGHDLLFKVPYGVLLKKDNNVPCKSERLLSNTTLFNSVLNWENTRFPSRISYSEFIDKNILQPLNTSYTNTLPPTLQSKVIEPNKIYSTTTYTNVDNINVFVNINMLKTVGAIVNCNITFKYEDNSLITKQFKKEYNDLEHRCFIVPLKNGVVKEVYIEQEGTISNTSSRLLLIDLLLTPIPKNLNMETTKIMFNNDAYGGIVGSTFDSDNGDINALISVNSDRGFKPFNATGNKTNNLPQLNGRPNFVGVSMNGGNIGSASNPTGFILGVEANNLNQVWFRKNNTDGVATWNRIIHEGWFPNYYTNYRPNNPTIGYSYFDKDKNKPLWWSGTNWVDATGTIN